MRVVFNSAEWFGVAVSAAIGKNANSGMNRMRRVIFTHAPTA
jgi:hypothetical protein